MWWHWDNQDDEKHERRFTNRQVATQLLPYFAAQLRTLGKASGLLLLAVVAQLAGPQILRAVITQAETHGNVEAVLMLAGLFIIVVIAGLALNFIMTIMITRAGLTIITQLKERLFRHVLSLNLKFFADYSPGKLLARVESDTENLKQLFSHAAIRLLYSLLIFFGIIGVMLYEDWRTTVAIVVIVPIMIGITVVFIRFIRRFYRASRRRYAEVCGFVTEYVQGVEVIQHYGYENRAREKLDDLNWKRLRMDRNTGYFSYGFWGLFAFFEIVATAAVIAVGSQKVVRGEMDIGTLVMFIEYLRQVFMPVMMLSEFINFVQQAFVSAERVFGILSIVPDDTPTPAALALATAAATSVGIAAAATPVGIAETPASPSPPIPPIPLDRRRPVKFDDRIRFERVSFAYEEGRDVLKDVAFEIRKGEKVAVVGPSGGGKTTLANLLLYFYEPRDGAIVVDGADLRTYSRPVWRSNIGLVLQGVHLFPGTLRENLTVFDPSVPDDAIVRAMEIVQAKPLLERLDGGLDHELAERGANLSQGERQLISFARALVHDPPILVLDEATASVDPITERMIQHSIDRMLAGRTAFVIAHRLATIVGADKILVVEHGQLTEVGTHAELYAAGGHYRRLFDLQFAQAQKGTA